MRDSCRNHTALRHIPGGEPPQLRTNLRLTAIGSLPDRSLANRQERVSLRAFDGVLTVEQMNVNDIKALIVAGLPGAQVAVETDDNTHFAALVVADQFDGKRTIQRHQLIYAALGNKMGNEIHALSIQALTPAEAAQRRE